MLFVSTNLYSQSLNYDTIVTVDGDTAIGDIYDVIDVDFNNILRFQKNKSLSEKAVQAKTKIPTAYISYVIWDGVKIVGENLNPNMAKQGFVVNNSTRGNLLVDNGNKKIKAGGILMAIGGAFMTSGLIMSTQTIDPKISTALMIVGGVNITFGGGFIASGVTRNEKIRRINKL